MIRKGEAGAGVLRLRNLGSDAGTTWPGVARGWGETRVKPSWAVILVTLLLLFAACGEQNHGAKIGAQGAKWLKEAESGSPEAQYQLGLIYLQSKRIPGHAAKGAEWLERAATQGHARAQFRLGRLYARGEGVPADPAKAAHWYQKAAAQGDADAQFDLAELYARGEGVPLDAAKALEWYEKAAGQGHGKAQEVLGWLYAEGKVVPKSVVEAVNWYEKAAAQGNADAQFDLAELYARGEGVPADSAKAVELYQKAGAQGHLEAQKRLAEIYYLRGSVPGDAAKAVEWAERAAAQGDAKAQFLLGLMYLNGEGTERDPVLAYAWCRLAAAHGGERQKQASEELRAMLTTSEVAEGKRLASAWAPGTLLAREDRSAAAGEEEPSQCCSGTGFLISPEGHILTSLHLVEGCTELRISGREGAAKLLAADSANDLALLQIPGETDGFARLTPKPSRVRQGEKIVVYGYPFKRELSSGGDLSPGVVTALTGLGKTTNQMQIAATLQPGSSGSPVIDKKGRVVGIVSLKSFDVRTAIAMESLPQNVNFAVSAQTVRSFLDAHKVPYETGSGFFANDKTNADLAAEARKWTVIVECWK
jgi:TPR repeat protein